MQKLIANRYRTDFTWEVNDHLNKGFNVVPGCVYAVPLHRDHLHFFSATIWKDGTEMTITGDDFVTFVTHINNYMKMGFCIVVGTLYASEMGNRSENKLPCEYDNYYFNVVNNDS